MYYREFTKEVTELLQEKGGEEYQFTYTEILKMNSHKRCAISIQRENENMGPTVYLEDYYDSFLNGMSLDEITDDILEKYQTAEYFQNYDISWFLDFRNVRELLYCKLINYEKNRTLLEKIPHKKFMDLAIIYYVKVESEHLPFGTILVQNNHLDNWMVTEKELYEVALNNTRIDGEFSMISMCEMFAEMGVMLEEEENNELPMYILTSKSRQYGAVSLVYRSVLRKASEMLLGDFYILPSSIHECILIPGSAEVDEDYLKCMVREINRDHVEPEEVLSDSVYFYDSECQLIICL